MWFTNHNTQYDGALELEQPWRAHILLMCCNKKRITWAIIFSIFHVLLVFCYTVESTYKFSQFFVNHQWTMHCNEHWIKNCYFEVCKTFFEKNRIRTLKMKKGSQEQEHWPQIPFSKKSANEPNSIFGLST